MLISSSHRRFLVLATAAFFIASVYLCTTRLFAMSFTRESFHGDTTGPPASGQDASTGTGVTDDKGNDANDGSEVKVERPPIKLNHADLPMSYGDYNRPTLDGLTLVDALPSEYIPTAENERRLIVIGDIHGMESELDTLLEEVTFNAEKDHIIAVGDMISKGPDSPGVVSRLMALNASAVRGNHEDRVLLAHEALKSQFGVMADLETTHAEDRRGELQDLVIARELSKDHLQWLAKLPVILTIDPLLLYIAHAGLVPGVDIKNQDPWAVMNMRTLVYPREELRKKADEPPRQQRRDETSSESGEPAMDDGPVLESFQEKADSEEESADRPQEREKGSDEGETKEKENSEMDTSPVPFDRRIVVPNDGRKGDSWVDAWNSQQLRLPPQQRRTVIYGHDAKVGYKETKFTFGLDSACYRGEALTALVIAGTEGGGFKHMTTQVRCQNKESGNR
ncbi:hypothetical protein ACO1O0_005343 [Amphichorda felina]